MCREVYCLFNIKRGPKWDFRLPLRYKCCCAVIVRPSFMGSDKRAMILIHRYIFKLFSMANRALLFNITRKSPITILSLWRREPLVRPIGCLVRSISGLVLIMDYPPTLLLLRNLFGVHSQLWSVGNCRRTTVCTLAGVRIWNLYYRSLYPLCGSSDFQFAMTRTFSIIARINKTHGDSVSSIVLISIQFIRVRQCTK